MEALYALLHKISSYLVIALAWFISWSVFYMTEIKIAGWRFKIGKFFISWTIFSCLTLFSNMIIMWWYLDIANNANKSIVLSIAIASFLYIFIPFALKDENRDDFIRWVLSRFWYEKISKWVEVESDGFTSHPKKK